MARCICGQRTHARGKCRRCYDAWRHSKTRFGGQREQVIVRDGSCCRSCGSRVIIVHHRPSDLLITLCRICHPRIHRIRRLRYGQLNRLLEALWKELHSDQPQQLLLPGFEERQLAAAA